MTNSFPHSLIPSFLSADEQRDHGKEMEVWRSNPFETEYLPLVLPLARMMGGVSVACGV